MPNSYSSPGVYIEESLMPPSIAGVNMNAALLVGNFYRGPVDRPQLLQSYAEFERIFGFRAEKWRDSFSAKLFFQNGGNELYVSRLFKGSRKPAKISVPMGEGSLTFEATSPGAWGNDLSIEVRHHDTRRDHFSLFIRCDFPYPSAKSQDVAAFKNISISNSEPRRLKDIFNGNPYAELLEDGLFTERPDKGIFYPQSPIAEQDFTSEEIIRNLLECETLLTAPVGLVCLADRREGRGYTKQQIARAAAFCERTHSILLLGPRQNWTTPLSIKSAVEKIQDHLSPAQRSRVALYAPNLLVDNPDTTKQQLSISPTLAIAGYVQKSDRIYGIWKAPAGVEATLSGFTGLKDLYEHEEANLLNSAGINSIRSLSSHSSVIWGAKTMDGHSQYGSDFTYLPVRRLTDYVTRSILQGSQWVAFEPNSEETWNALNQRASGFLKDLYRTGAFAGTTESTSFFVHCDPEIVTPDDLEKGRIPLQIGFAPVRPAEFVILNLAIPCQPLRARQ
ncbi:MAG: hypothetical protein MI743_21510 [Sneathiellales bacterium]|nr:hypothetical protein [Sneathiellales bacterium]